MKNTMLILTRPNLLRPAVVLCALLAVLGTATPQAHAQDEEADQSEQDFDSEEVDESLTSPAKVRHGVGLRLRYVFFPKSMLELFMEEAASGMGHGGFGLDYVRRKGDVEISVGFEYDKLGPDDGYYVERGGDPMQAGTTDFVEFDGLGWFTIDASIVYHYPLTKQVALRYGGGIGFGIVSGDVIESDARCTGPDLQGGDCSITGPQINEKQDFFRYPPVFNLQGGVQFTPHKDVRINLELGLRTIFYTGLSAQYFFK